MRSSLAGRIGARPLAPFAALAVPLAVLLWLWQGRGYWNYSDGVYALSAREVAGGAALYRDFAAAQPPLVYLAGAGVLLVHDGLLWLRAALGLVDLATAALVAVAVARLTARRALAAGAGGLSLLAPWTLHEHAQLTPETLAAPLLLGAALLGARRRTSVVAGAIAAVAVAAKVAFALPALALALGAVARRRALGGLVGTGVLLAVATLTVWGGDAWRNVVRAQSQVGLNALHYVAGLWAQGAWNELPLLVLAAVAVTTRRRAADPELLRALLALALGVLLLPLTLLKQGSYLNVLAVVEPPLVVLAAAGVAWLPARRGLPRVAVVVVLALGAAQVASLLLAPANPRVFARPGAERAPGRALSGDAVEGAVRAAARCPAGVPYAGPPALAFAARRPISGGEPDPYIVEHAAVHRARLAAVRRDARAHCP